MTTFVLPLPSAPWYTFADDEQPASRRAWRRSRVAEETPAQTPPDGEIDLDELYQSSYHDMVRLARQLVDDVESAQDVVHDAFLGLYRNRHSLESPANARAYLRTAVTNQARSALRRRRTAREQDRKSVV